MKTKNFLSTIGSAVATGAVLAILQASPARANAVLVHFSGHSLPPQCTAQCATTACAKPSATVTAGKKTEIQVAIMANSATQPATRRSMYIHR